MSLSTQKLVETISSIPSRAIMLRVCTTVFPSPSPTSRRKHCNFHANRLTRVNLRCQHFGQTCQSSQTHCFQGVGLRTCHQRIHCRGLCLPTWRRSPAVSRVPRAAGALQSVLASDVIAIRRKLRCTAVAGKIWFQRTKIQGFEGPTGLEG